MTLLSISTVPVHPMHADGIPCLAKNMRRQARRRCLTVGTGNRGYRNPAVVRRVREEHIHHMLAHGTWRAMGRRHMHAETRSGIDFDDTGRLLIQRYDQVFGQKIDADHIEPDKARQPVPS